MSKRNGGSKGKIVGLIALVVILALIVGATAVYEGRQQKARKAELEELAAEIKTGIWSDENTVLVDDELYGFDHRIESYLFIGTDEKTESLSEDYDRAMADFLLLMVMDHTDNTYGFIQIDRNTVTEVSQLDENGNPVIDRELQICTAQWYGTTAEMGARNLERSVRRLLGDLENIDGFYEISMKDIAALNRAVGGVEITFDEDLTAANAAFKKGATVTLDDAQAESFLRARMSVGEGTNAERMGRQRQYMTGLFARIREHVKSNPKYGLELWKALRSIAVTNMIGNDFSRIAQKLLKGEDKGILRLEGETRLGEILEDGVEHEEFYPRGDSILQVMTELYSLVPADPDDIVSDDDPDESAEAEEDEYDPDDEDESEDDEDESEYDDEDESDGEDESEDESEDEEDIDYGVGIEYEPEDDEE